MAKDILNDEFGDIVVDETKGIFFDDQSEEQLLMKLMYLNVGSLKHSVMTGAGIRSIPNSRVDQNAIKKVYVQLEVDGWSNEDVNYDSKQIGVYANRNI